MITAVVLLAFNLRPAVNALGVVLDDVQHATGISGTTAGLLAALPTLCFAVTGLAVSGLASRIGANRAVVLALVMLTVGQLIRATGSVPALFVGSILALGSITVGNVLLPGLIRRHFPTAIGPMTAVYTTMLMIGQSAGAGLTLPLQGALGGTWRMGIGMWAVTSILALVPWIAAVLRRGPEVSAKKRGAPSAETSADDEAAPEQTAPDGASPAPAPSSAPAPAAVRISVLSLARSKHAWAMAIFFGIQSLQAYVVFGWVPTVLKEAGMSGAGAGGVMAIITATGIPISAVVPSVLSVMKRHEPLVVMFISSMALGYLGMLIMPMTLPWLSGLLVGFGLGAFPMALTLLALRAHTPEGTTALSGFGQSVGYLLASAGPVGFGMLHDATGGSTWPLIALLCTLVPMVVAGMVVVRDWKIEDDLKAR